MDLVMSCFVGMRVKVDIQVKILKPLESCRLFSRKQHLYLEVDCTINDFWDHMEQQSRESGYLHLAKQVAC